MRVRVEFAALVALALIAGGVLGFFALLQVAGAETPHAWDERVLLFFRVPGNLDDPIGPAWVEEAVRDVTSLGGVSVLVIVVAAGFFGMFLAQRHAAAWFLLGSVAGGQVLSTLLKTTVDRPRPDLVPRLAETFTQSFPSGHAMLSAVTYLTVGALLARVMPGPGLKRYVMGVAILLTLLIGVSRIYLGVHWPSDVLAGWCAGAAWATLCWLVSRAVLSRRQPNEGVAASREP